MSLPRTATRVQDLEAGDEARIITVNHNTAALTDWETTTVTRRDPGTVVTRGAFGDHGGSVWDTDHPVTVTYKRRHVGIAYPDFTNAQLPPSASRYLIATGDRNFDGAIAYAMTARLRAGYATAAVTGAIYDALPDRRQGIIPDILDPARVAALAAACEAFAVAYADHATYAGATVTVTPA